MSGVTSPVPLPPSPLPLLPNLPLLPEAFHWDRIAEPIVLKVNSNQNRIALAAVGHALEESLSTIHVSPDEHEIDGPELGSQFSIELFGEAAKAAERAQYILRPVKKDDDTHSAQDDNGHVVPVFLNGDEECHTQKLEGTTKRPTSLIRSK